MRERNNIKAISITLGKAEQELGIVSRPQDRSYTIGHTTMVLNEDDTMTIRYPVKNKRGSHILLKSAEGMQIIKNGVTFFLKNSGGFLEISKLTQARA